MSQKTKSAFKPCQTCPFIETSKNYGAPDWLNDVYMQVIRGTFSHSCHCTDPRADGYVAGQPRDCDGFKMVKVNNEAGVKIHPTAFRSWLVFFNTQLEAIARHLT